MFSFCVRVNRAHTGPIKFLVDAIEARRMLWVFCIGCGHAQRLHPWRLSKKGGGLQTLDDVAKKCRCKKCGRQDTLVMPSRDYFEGRG
jgi:Zn ribbon nucleic-acid-binding protein